MPEWWIEVHNCDAIKSDKDSRRFKACVEERYLFAEHDLYSL